MATSLLASSMRGVLADDTTTSHRKFTVDLRASSIGVSADLDTTIQLAAKHGFESVGADPYAIGNMAESQISDLKQRLKDAGLVWGSAGLPIQFREDEKRFRDDLSKLPVRAAALRVAGVTRMGTWIMPCHATLPYRDNFLLHAKRLRQCAKILNDHGIRFGIEYVGTKTLRDSKRYAFISSMAEARQLNEAIAVENMGLIMDSWHWYTAGETAQHLKTLSNQEIVACDLNDAPADRTIDTQVDNQRELPAATGVIDVKTFLAGLSAVGYDGPIRAEPFNTKLNAMDNDAACAATCKALFSAVNA
ncbi:MAG: sugar phosphate isomerase/epimerase family protein [Planctomycetota bacterium]